MTMKGLKQKITKTLKANGFPQSKKTYSSIRGGGIPTAGFTYELSNPYNKENSKHYLIWYSFHGTREQIKQKEQEIFNIIKSEFGQNVEMTEQGILLKP